MIPPASVAGANPALQATAARSAVDAFMRIRTLILQAMSRSAAVPELGRSLA
jgi:hypothetical protein